MGFTSSDIETRIRRGARLKSSSATYTQAVIFDMIDEVIRGTVAPKIDGVNEDYRLAYKDVSLVANANRYAIPRRATLNRLHSLYRLNSDKSNAYWLGFRSVRDMSLSSTGNPAYHDFIDDSVIISPTPTGATEYLRMYYHYVPSTLVLPAACMEITGGESTGVLTGVSLAAWDETTDLFDIVAAESPFSIVHSDLTASSISAGTSITFTLTDLDTDRLTNGGTYYVCLAGQTCFPMCPMEAHPMIRKLVIAEIRDEIGDEGYAQKKMDAEMALLAKLEEITPRKPTEAKPVRNRSSSYRQFSYNRY